MKALFNLGFGLIGAGRDKSRQRGFTLIATLLIVSLLTILTVSAMVVVQVEQQASYNTSEQETARQNALFGLNQALNQLQFAAGPDRRVTGRADILSSTSNAGGGNGYQGTQPATDSGQCFWTGVWKNTLNDYSGCAGNGLVSNPDPFPGSSKTPGPGGSFFYYDFFPDGTSNPGTPQIPSRTTLYNNSNVNWLISWPFSPTFTTPPDPTQSLSSQNISASQTVTIASNLNGKSTSSDNTSVVVPKVPIRAALPGTATPAQVGSFAYWVSDEGVKARVDLPNPYMASSSLPSSQASYQVAQSPAVNLALYLNSGMFPHFTSPPPLPLDLRTLSLTAPTLASLAYADPSGSWSDFTNASTYSSDFTTCSLGVLADSFNGGLRRDLTAAFEYPALYVNNFGNTASFDGLGVGGNSYESLRKVFSTSALSQSSYGTSITGVVVKGIASVPYAGAANGNDIILDGLRWDSLFYFYNTYHTTMPSPVSNPQGAAPNGIGSSFTGEPSGVVPNITARFYQEPDPANNSHHLNMDGILPVRVLWNYNILAGLTPTNTKANPGPPYTFNYVFGMSPNVVMYNPYNVGVVMPPRGGWEWWANVGNSLLHTYMVFNKPSGGAELTQILGFTDERIQIGYDSIAYSPGELRCYGLAGDNMIGETETLGGDRNWAYFYQNGDSYQNYNNQTLTSVKMVSNACQYETITPPASAGTISINDLNDTVVCQRTDLMLCSAEWQQPCVYTDNFPLWPASNGTSLTNNPNAGSYLLGSMPSVGTSVSNFAGNLGTVSSLESTVPTQPIVAFVDHVAGLNCSSFVPWGNLAPNTAFGLPFFSAGGALLNPLNIDINAYSRDYRGLQIGGTASSPVAVQANSSNDLQTQYNLSLGNVADTGWFPNSVGEDSIPPTGPTPRVIYDLPRQPLISMGQFKNMYCHYLDSAENNGLLNGYYVLDFPVYPVGGSYQEGLATNNTFVLPATIGPDLSHSQQQEALGELFDANFLANETLFDGYFLSTIPPKTLTDAANWPINAANFSQNYISSNQPLPNSRLVYYNRSQSTSGNNKGNPPTPFSLSPNIADLQPSTSTFNLRKPAANLLIRGAFNVNSTSISAWTALLSSTYANANPNNKLFLFSYGNGPLATVTQTSFPNTDVPILHSLMGFGSVFWTGSAGNNVPWFGLTDLTTTTIQLLATQIVTQVKARGPFLSLGDFLNHRLTAAQSNLSDSGALQSAIDTLNINSNVSSASGVTPSLATTSNAVKVQTPLTCNFPTTFTASVLPTAPSSAGMGVPGTLLQSDLVQLLAPVIANRSDTFTVRAYGESVNPKTQVIQGRAWCEAVVQRLPEYVYSTENGTLSPNGNFAYDEPSQSINNNMTGISGSFPVNGISPVNSAMGRRFKIVSFRWLNQSEL